MKLDPKLIAAIQSKPDVHYDSRLVTKEQALAAYDAALIVCAAMAKYIRRTTAQTAFSEVQIRIGGGSAIQGWRWVTALRCPRSS